MKRSRIITFLIAGALAGTAFYSCNEPVKDDHLSFSDNSEFLKKCTPIYKGISYVLEETTEDLTLYKIYDSDEYYIPNFFKGQGELLFLWDKSTNTLTVEESDTGLSNGIYPVYIMSQRRYDEYKGNDAMRSFFDIATNTFNFNVLMETADDYGMIYVDTQIIFEIKSSLTNN